MRPRRQVEPHATGQQQRLLPGQRTQPGRLGGCPQSRRRDRFTSQLTRLQAEHPIFRRRRFFRGNPWTGPPSTTSADCAATADPCSTATTRSCCCSIPRRSSTKPGRCIRTPADTFTILRSRYRGACRSTGRALPRVQPQGLRSETPAWINLAAVGIRKPSQRTVRDSVLVRFRAVSKLRPEPPLPVGRRVTAAANRA